MSGSNGQEIPQGPTVEGRVILAVDAFRDWPPGQALPYLIGILEAAASESEPDPLGELREIIRALSLEIIRQERDRQDTGGEGESPDP